MSRTRRSLVVTGLLLVATLAPASVDAFHSSSSFDDDASEGGAGGLLYTGSPRHLGYDCGACHTGAEGRATLAPTVEPASLFSDREYEPGAIYDFIVVLQGETKGLDAQANYNSMALEILDADGEPVGGFFGFDGNLMATVQGDAALFSRGTRDETEWSFSWQAPEAGRGYLDFYLVGVDGNGAGDAEESNSDPQGDDVIAGAFRIAEQGIEAPPFERVEHDPGEGVLGRRRDVTGCRVAPSTEVPGWWLVLLVLGPASGRAASRSRRPSTR